MNNHACILHSQLKRSVATLDRASLLVCLRSRTKTMNSVNRRTSEDTGAFASAPTGRTSSDASNGCQPRPVSRCDQERRAFNACCVTGMFSQSKRCRRVWSKQIVSLLRMSRSNSSPPLPSSCDQMIDNCLHRRSRRYGYAAIADEML